MIKEQLQLIYVNAPERCSDGDQWVTLSQISIIPFKV